MGVTGVWAKNIFIAYLFRMSIVFPLFDLKIKLEVCLLGLGACFPETL